MWVTSLYGNCFNEMLMPVLWVINPVSLKLGCEQIENSFTAGEVNR
jgi:hypothetical protein